MLLKQLHHHGGVRGLTKTTAVPRASFEDSSIDDGCSTLPEDAALIPNAVHGDLGEEKVSRLKKANKMGKK
jgi:hypothetical protein